MWKREKQWCVSYKTRGVCMASLMAPLVMVGHSERAVRTSGVVSVMEGKGCVK